MEPVAHRRAMRSSSRWSAPRLLACRRRWSRPTPNGSTGPVRGARCHGLRGRL